MTLRKKRLIQERNILLERRYIFEQGTTPTTGTTQSVGTTGSTQSTGTTSPTTTTTTTLKKLSDKEITNLPECSEGNFKDKKSGFTTNEFVIYVTSKDLPICKKPK